MIHVLRTRLGVQSMGSSRGIVVRTRPVGESLSLRPTTDLTADTSPIAERHYSVQELAVRWNLSSDTVRMLFENEAGVLVIGNEVRKYSRRRYITLRIPESVAERVHRRITRV
jgi:hypothetical protein